MGRISSTVGGQKCGVQHLSSKHSRFLSICDHLPMLSIREIACGASSGKDVTMGLLCRGSAVLLVGGRFRSCGLAQRSGVGCGRLVGSPRGSRTKRGSGTLLKGVTGTDNLQKPRMSSIVGCVGGRGIPSMVIYKSFGRSPVSCSYHQLSSVVVSDTCHRSKGNLKLSCGRDKFCFHVSRVFISSS